LLGGDSMWGIVKQRVEVPKHDLKYFEKYFHVDPEYTPEGFNLTFERQNYDVRCVFGQNSFDHLFKVYCYLPQNLRFHTLMDFEIHPVVAGVDHYSTGYYDPEYQCIIGIYSSEGEHLGELQKISGLVALNPKTKILKPAMRTIEKEFPNISIYVENSEYAPKLLIHDFKHENLKFIEVVEFDIEYIGFWLYYFLGFDPKENRLYLYARHEGIAYDFISYVRVKFNCVTIP